MPNLDLPAVADEDANTHVADHNKIRQSLIDLNTLAGMANEQSGSYTLVLSDAGRMIEASTATTATIAVPNSSAVSWLYGTRVDLLQTGAGVVTIAANPGVTVNSRGDAFKLAGQWAAATLLYRGGNTWVLVGSLAT